MHDVSTGGNGALSLYDVYSGVCQGVQFLSSGKMLCRKGK